MPAWLHSPISWVDSSRKLPGSVLSLVATPSEHHWQNFLVLATALLISYGEVEKVDFAEVGSVLVQEEEEKGRVLSREIHLDMARSSLFTLPWVVLSSGRDMKEAQLLQGSPLFRR